MLNVANPSRETTPLLRPPHSDLGGGLKRGVPLYLLFVVATEAHDDDGLPHTLEHLVFMGSEKYPYKVGK